MGGIRISHVSGIKVPITLALTEKRGSRKPYTVLPLVQPEPNAPTPANVEKARDAASKGMAALKAFWDALDAAQQKFLKPYMGELKETATNADKAAASAPAFADVGAQFEAEQRGRADYAAGIIKLPDEYKGAEKEALAEAWFKGWDKAKASAEVAPAEPVELVADRDAEMAKLRDAA